jgi:4-amino-4-deoxy-L-arabinose transferase-like glycosyltransferase
MKSGAFDGWRIPLPLPAAGLVLLAALYGLMGLFGHDPWKPEDAIGMGVVQRMLEARSLDPWLLPQLAGERFLEDGPLYYALAALCAKLLSFILEPHDGARLASALCLFIALWFLRRAGQEMFGRREPGEPGAHHGNVEGDGAALILMGTLGLFVHAHEVLGENGALAGAAIAWYGFARARTNEVRGGLWFGLGLAVALWSKGPGPLAPLLAATLAAPLLGGAWRTRGHLRFALIGLGLTMLAALAWYFNLRAQGSSLPAAWWNAHGAHMTLGGERALRQLQLLCWATWPAWPLALWALRDRRHRLKNDPILPVAVGVIAALLVFLFNFNINEVHAMPLMLPLALAAGAGAPALRRGAANALAWFGAMTFTTLAGFVWLGWIAMTTGAPQRLARNFSKLEPGFVPSFDAGALAIALVLSLLWIALLWRSERSLHRSTAFWAGGVTLLWGLAMTLWLPWIDYGKTYRPVATSLAAAIRTVQVKGSKSCIDSRGLGEAQRAAFDYHAGIITRRLEVHRSSCPLLLVQADARQSGSDRTGPGWRRVWEGNRPRDRERFRLYLRD